MHRGNVWREKGQKLVVVVGGGFAGLNVAKGLANRPGVHVLLVDQRNHHLFQPLLYQVATAGLNPADIAVAIRTQFREDENVEVQLGRVKGVDLAGKVLQTDQDDLEFDYLVLACGAQHSYFGHGEWEEHAPGLKTLEQATEIRRRMLSAFEEAERETSEEKRRALMTFAVVGAGPTGVELAGAIADIARTVLHDEFKRIDTAKTRVLLIEAGPRVLASFAPDLSERASRDLQEIGVEVRLNAPVSAIDAESVTVGAERILARSTFWAAGVQAARLELTGGDVWRDRAGRVKVASDFSIPGHKDVFVVGDMASFEHGGPALPGVAPVAVQGGRHVAECILRDLERAPRRPFRYLDKGQMATIGRNRAVLQTGRLKMSGHLAWLAWLLVHLFYLIGFRNRLAVLAGWAWSYLFSKRGARIITQKKWQLGA
jgi:NADH:ubiquinone reductase (H+-translocating)